MAIKIIKERQGQQKTEYNLYFDYRNSMDGGYVFPCDIHGNPLFDSMTKEAIANYHRCVEDTEKFLSPYVKTIKYRWVEPAIGECYCGEEVVLESQYMGACQCSKCGQWYNIYGQSLIPPEYWEDDGY